MRVIKNVKKLEGKRVLLRVDFNVPLKNKVVMDDTRLLASIPTVEYLIKNKAKVILVAHLGRPNGKIVPSLKIDPVANKFGRLIKKKIKKLETKNWKLKKAEKEKILKEIEKMRPGQIAILENIRFSTDEEKNTGKLAKELSSIADIFVSDGFAVAHRASASVVGVAKYLPAYAGLLMEKELDGLSRISKRPKKPFVGIMGGIKTATKTPLIKKLLPKINYLLVGGGMLNTYLHLKGYKIGASVYEKSCTKKSLKCITRSKIIMPADLIVGNKKGDKYRLVSVGKKPGEICKKNEAIYDIGPETICLFSKYIKKSQTLFWNGAMGYFEQKPYNIGTLAIARLVASRSKGKAFGVVGGGETLQALEIVKMSEHIDLISTGGGAMLEFLSGKKLPGVQVLKKRLFSKY
jgi:phosphoglycerate kinase